MKLFLLLTVIVLAFMLVGCSDIHVGFGISVGVHLVRATDEYIEFQIVDEYGRPLSNITLQVQLDDRILQVTTDADGCAKIYGNFVHGRPYLLIIRYAVFEVSTTITLK